MLQTNVREGYRITTLEVVELIEDLISYLRNAQILKVFYEAAYSAKVKIEDLSNTLMLILSEIAQQRSSSVVSNRFTALITDKFSVASLTKPAILNDANVTLVDAVHHSVQKLEENYFEVRAQHLKYDVIDALTMTLIKDDDDLLGTVNSYIKLRRLRARRKTKAADSRHAKASRGRTKKDKDLEDSNTSSDRLGKEAQLKKTRDEEELAKAKKEKEEKEAQERETYSSDIDSEDDLEDEEATTAKDLAREQKERLKALLNANDSPLENIGRLTKEEAIEMRINTTNAISKALAAANKLFVIVCSFRKVDKHVFRAYNTMSVTAQRTIICKGSSYIEKRAILLPSHFNATNKRDSVTGDRIYKIEDARNMIANVKHDVSEHESSYNCLCLDFLSTVQNAKQQCRDILEKEGLDELEASRRIIFNCFEICKVKRFTLNSVKDLFTNLSKDYFLVREARAITKSSPNQTWSIAVEDAAKAANTLLLPKEVRAKILIGSYKPIKFSDESILVMQGGITQHEINLKLLAEMCVSIIYFNLDSELELKVLGKQDVKITS
ncbi:hypothetical protein HBH75_101520 [Parastagonospora nodorum]|nr:hypothetical protein HBH75_101520 [Parastagonospora nodorum]